MNVLYIGGTGEISYACLLASAALGHKITLFNRGTSTEPLPPNITQIHGNLSDDASYSQLAAKTWDVVCQFKAYKRSDIQRDLHTFAGKTAQYLFISSASVYQKPPQSYVLTEAHPVGNKFWDYSQTKADMEADLLAAHAAGKMPVTILRPSHTYRRNFPGIALPGDDNALRLLQNKPIIIHGDGTSLWTYTHASDFATPFTRLLGNPKTLGQTYHLTAHLKAYTWNRIYTTAAHALGVKAQLVHIPTDTLIRSRPELTGNLMGDKAWPSLFDNTKINAVVGEWKETITLEAGLKAAATHVKKRLETHQPDATLHAWADKIIAAQQMIQ